MDNLLKDVIIACDFSDKKELYAFLDRFGEKRPFLKIGMELFYAYPETVRELKARGHRIFLDLKLHDIPNTVMKAMSVLSGMGADIVNIHAGGGSEMMKAAKEGLTRRDGTRPLLIAVTLLTSISEKAAEEELLLSRPLSEAVISYAINAKNSGLDGVVCSPLEAKKVKEVCGEAFLTVTPGIRLPDGNKGDQIRIATPEFARENGSDFIVVGRPITKADDPLSVYKNIKAVFCGEAR